MLDEVRAHVGSPLTITSGLRCAWQNERLHGEPASGHLDGTEADVACTTSRLRYRVLTFALAHGVRRIGVYPRHIHLGVSKRLPQDVVWIGS